MFSKAKYPAQLCVRNISSVCTHASIRGQLLSRSQICSGSALSKFSASSIGHYRRLPDSKAVAEMSREYHGGRGGGGGGRGGGGRRGGGGGGYGRGRGGGGGYGRGGGKGGRGESDFNSVPETPATISRGGASKSGQELISILRQIDNRSYLGVYKCTYEDDKNFYYHLFVDHIQSDSYAPPSRFRVQVPTEIAGIPESYYESRIKTTAFCDYVTRHLAKIVKARFLDQSVSGSGWSGPKGGAFDVNGPNQQVLERTSCSIKRSADGAYLEIRFTVSLPAAGRTIMGRKAQEILVEQLPSLVKNVVSWGLQNQSEIDNHIKTVRVQDSLRKSLPEKGLVAFIGNGSILPRQSGVSPLPMKGNPVRFQSPPTLEVEIETDVSGKDGKPIKVKGMGIKRGITVITGGGFHGKTTLLEALELGIYNVAPGDGRELVVIEPNAFKIRAEDGRNIVNTDLTPYFVKTLPGGMATKTFTSEDASGSTSMAANIQEALEIGATALLIDEDTSATNFLMKDRMMMEFIKKDPIVPYVTKANALFEKHGVSTIIVVGGCGEYLAIADTIISMEEFTAHDRTSAARALLEKYQDHIPRESVYGAIPDRVPLLPQLHRGKASARGTRSILLKPMPTQNGIELSDTIELGALEQFVETGQVQTCGEALRYLSMQNPKRSIRDLVGLLKELVDEKGLDALHSEKWLVGDLVRTRELELLGALNRVRGLQVTKLAGEDEWPMIKRVKVNGGENAE
ncbi:hypothetical protein RUND412_000213 [Rhizina undulata]